MIQGCAAPAAVCEAWTGHGGVAAREGSSGGSGWRQPHSKSVAGTDRRMTHTSRLQGPQETFGRLAQATLEAGRVNQGSEGAHLPTGGFLIEAVYCGDAYAKGPAAAEASAQRGETCDSEVPAGWSQTLRPPFQRDQILLQCGGPRFRLLGVLPLGFCASGCASPAILKPFHLLCWREPSAVRSEAIVAAAHSFQFAVACTAVPAAQARTTRRLGSTSSHLRACRPKTAQVRTAAAAAAAAARLHHCTTQHAHGGWRCHAPSHGRGEERIHPQQPPARRRAAAACQPCLCRRARHPMTCWA